MVSVYMFNPNPLEMPVKKYRDSEAQKQQLKHPQTPILIFWPSNILAVAVKSRKGLSFEEQMTLCSSKFSWEAYLKS
jgi:hypothetical protein